MDRRTFSKRFGQAGDGPDRKMVRRLGAAGSAERRRFRYAEAGFTLLELLIVIAVLGILAGTVVFSLQGVQSSAASAACQSDFATTTEAVNAYQAQMGGYPGASTDVDPATAPAFTPGAAPAGVNAARPRGELLVAGAVAPNHGGAPGDGPWLRASPDSEGHYGIWVANDGSGTVQVLDAAGHVPANLTHTAADCAAVVSAGAATTTTVVPTTTTTRPPATTTTLPSTTTTTTRVSPTTSTTTTTSSPRRAPAITSENRAAFRYGVFGSFTVAASGSPSPSLRIAGSLPSGVSFNRNSGLLSGTPRRSGSYRLTFSASNGIRPNAVQSFTLAIH